MILIINNLIEIFILKGNNSIFNNIYHIYSIFQFDVLKVTDQCYLIDSFSAKDKFYCFNKCNMYSNCTFFTRLYNECKFYSEKALNYLVKSDQSFLYKKTTNRLFY